jgi:hypothetical protein
MFETNLDAVLESFKMQFNCIDESKMVKFREKILQCYYKQWEIECDEIRNRMKETKLIVDEFGNVKII